MQKVIHSENILANVGPRSTQLFSLLETRLTGPNALSKPYVADIRGGGLFCGVEFEVSDEDQVKLAGKRLGPRIQEIAFEKGLVIIGMSGTVDGVKGEHTIIAPALNVTEQEIEKMVDLYVEAVEESVKPLLG